ncbi:MAG: tetratricopeptide repeat protein [Desulfovibrionaceae bacterium]
MKLPVLKESRMVTNGFAVWLAWRGDLNPAVPQTLADYGGIRLVDARDQSLWFFFNEDVFLSVARLEIWARLNPLPVFSQIIPAKLLLGFKLNLTMVVDSALSSQEAMIPEEFESWVHTKAAEDARRIPGLTFSEPRKVRGLSAAMWQTFAADPRLPYDSSLGWYMVLKPLGNPLDKNFQSGWRAFFRKIEEILQLLKFKYLVHDNFVIFPLGRLRELRLFCKEFLAMVQTLKDSEDEAEVAQYWPCVMATVGKKGYNFNNELPKKIHLDWEMLMPDYPHMSYRSAFLLGEGFKVNDVRFSVDQSKIDDWCNVSLSDDQTKQHGTIAIELPKRVVAGVESACFYCGLRNHAAPDCPTRSFERLNAGVWDKISAMTFDDINQGFAKVEEFLAKYPTASEGLRDAVVGEEPQHRLVQAIFEINAPVQHRMMFLMWRCRGKEFPGGLTQLMAPEEMGVNLQPALDSLLSGELLHADKFLSQATVKAPRSFQTRTLQGFVAMEKGDPAKAGACWKEAEGLSSSPILQSYHMYLQARALEMQARYQSAIAIYKQVLHLSPRWLDALYRQGVCLVKMGFAEQAMGFFSDLIRKDPHMFNRTLIDPELERGHLHLLMSLHGLWRDAETASAEEKLALIDLHKEAERWFSDDHPFAQTMFERIANMHKLAESGNFVGYQRMIRGRKQLARDFKLKIEEESKGLKEQFQSFMDRLRDIRAESAWFPFPKLLVDFNRDFNFCAKNVNWALKQHFQVAETFRRAQDLSESVTSTIKLLESRLKTLKIVRDATLFMLIMGKTFFWLELIGLVLSLALLPLTIYYGSKMGYPWADGLVVKQKWEIQKGLIMAISIGALALGAFRAAVGFEKKKRKLFERYGA